jgi:hypothetical protein
MSVSRSSAIKCNMDLARALKYSVNNVSFVNMKLFDDPDPNCFMRDVC